MATALTCWMTFSTGIAAVKLAIAFNCGVGIDLAHTGLASTFEGSHGKPLDKLVAHLSICSCFSLANN
jgi:hypothetical protein